MQLVFYHSGISKPTVETFEEYSKIKFPRLQKLYAKKEDSNPLIQVSIKKEPHEFDMSIETFFRGKMLVVKEKAESVKEVIDKCYKTLRYALSTYKKCQMEHKAEWKSAVV